MNRTRWLALLSVLLVVGLGAWWWKARAAKAAPKYRTAEVEQGSIEATVSATGSIRPVIQVQVGSQVSGTLQNINVDFNSRVHKGEVLCQIDPSSFRARAVQAQAAVAKAEASVKDARRSLARAQELVKQNYVSQAEVDAADVALEQRVAELMQARALLQVANVDLSNTTIRAPIDGVVIAKSIEPGQTVAASLQAPELFVIANDLAKMQVETRIDEADIGRIHAGLPATFTVDAFPDATFQGTVFQVRLEPITEQGVVTYTTVIHTGNPDLKLRPGMTANVSIQVARSDGVLKAPAAALRFRPPAAKGESRGGTFTAASASERNGPAGAARPGGAGSSASGPMAAERGAGGGDRARWGGSAARGDSAGRGGPGMRMRGRPAAGALAGDPVGGGRRGWRGGAQGAATPARLAADPAGDASRSIAEEGIVADDAFKPGRVFVLKAGKPEPVPVLTGITDGAFVEIRTDRLNAGDLVVIGVEQTQADQRTMTPPPGMGGPQFRGPGGGRGGGGGRR